MTTKPGRPQAIPPRAYGEVKRLHNLGYGYQRISRLLEAFGVCASQSSVERLLRGRRPYPSN